MAEINEAIQQQLAQIAFAHTSQFVSEPASLLAERLISGAPARFSGGGRAYFVSGGSEAIETALKLARGYFYEQGISTKRIAIARWSSYHGSTQGALATTGHPARRAPYLPMLADSPHISPSYPYRCACGAPGACVSEACGLALAGELEEEILKLGYENVMMHCRRGWELRWSMSRFNLKMRLLLIRRPAQWFAVNHWNVVPDIMVLAKGIASGFTMAAVVARKELMQKCLPGKHGSTYGGNPVACASALASIQIIEDEGLLENAREMGAYLSNSLRRLACEHKFIGDVRGFGLMLGIELIESEGQPDGKRLAAVVEACVERRLLLLDCGSYDHVIRFLPPLNVSRAELNEGLSIFADALKAVSLFTAT